MHESLGRMEFFARLGRITVAENMIDEAAKYVSEMEWRRQSGAREQTSIYVSKFPGGPRPCERQLLYGLMNVPSEKQMPQMVSGTAAVGKAIEDWEVSMLEADGRLLSTTADAQDQVRIHDADHWLSGKMDIVILPKFWNRPLLIEKKTKDSDVLDDMRNLKRVYDPAHAFQTRVYIAILRQLSHILWPRAVVCKHTWRLGREGNEPVLDAMWCQDHGIHADSGCLIEIDLEPLSSGVLSYSGRNRPNVRASWYFEHDEAWWQNGLKVLESVKRNFINDVLPPHPFGGKQWSAQPCNWCDYKKNACKPDHVAGVEKLSESHGNEWARGVYGFYDLERIRERVLARWKDLSGVGYTLPEGYKIGRYGVQKERVNV